MLSNNEAPATANTPPGHEPQCSVCAHPKRPEIDRFLLQSSVRRAAALYGLSKSSVHRHRDRHMADLLAAGEQILARRLELAAPQLRARLEEIHWETLEFFRANNGVDRVAAARAIALLTRQVEVGLRLAAAVPATPAIGPDAMELYGRALLRALQPYPEVRGHVVTALREVESHLGLAPKAA